MLRPAAMRGLACGAFRSPPGGLSHHAYLRLSRPCALVSSPRVHSLPPERATAAGRSVATFTRGNESRCVPRAANGDPDTSGDNTAGSGQAVTTHQVLLSAPSSGAGRLPEALGTTFPAKFPTLSAARRVIRRNEVMVDGALGSCSTQVTPGQLLQHIAVTNPGKPERRVLELQVIHEDDSLAVVLKPYGVKIHGGDGRRTVTGALANGVLKPSSAEGALERAQPVHRLDAAVGGLLVVAKTRPALVALSEAFAKRQVSKTYRALLCGRLLPRDLLAPDGPEAEEGEGSSGEEDLDWSSMAAFADRPSEDAESEGQGKGAVGLIPGLHDENLRSSSCSSSGAGGVPDIEHARCSSSSSGGSIGAQAGSIETPQANLHGTVVTSSSSSSSEDDGGSGPIPDGSTYTVTLPLDGKRCCSKYRVLSYSRSPRYGGWMTTVELSPVTGRKHQLRRHVAALGHPIVGDGLYTKNTKEHIANQGLYLEAVSLRFMHPESGEVLEASIPEPARFVRLRDQQQSGWNKQQRTMAWLAMEQQQQQQGTEEEQHQQQHAAELV